MLWLFFASFCSAFLSVFEKTVHNYLNTTSPFQLPGIVLVNFWDFCGKTLGCLKAESGSTADAHAFLVADTS